MGIGILSGLITMLVRYIGLFLQGFFLGVLVAFAGKANLQLFSGLNLKFVIFIYLLLKGKCS